MKFTFAHNNFNVLDLDKSLAFYRKALGLEETRRITPKDGNFILVFLGDGETPHRLELTWLRGRKEPYDLGENEFHLAFQADDFRAAHELHASMGCISYENPGMGIYFISDPDGYWIEIVPKKYSLGSLSKGSGISPAPFVQRPHHEMGSRAVFSGNPRKYPLY